MKFSALNDEQKKAVTFKDNLLLTACPGSGKTRVITHKVSWEIENLKSSKKKVVALTFTIRAAEEIEKRLERANVDSNRFWTGNIHSFCLNWILRPYASFYSKTRKGFTIIDSIQSMEILSEICQKLSFDPKILQEIKTRIKPNGSFVETDEKHIQLLTEYNEHITANRLVDFDRLLYYSYDLLSKYPKIAQTLSSIFSVILIDEYQDTQELQYQIIFEIFKAGKGNTRVCFVGDPDQAIYGSLGGVAKTKAEIEEGLNCSIQHFTLPGNYRSNQRIIDYYRNFQDASPRIEARGTHANESGCITHNSSIHKDELEESLATLIRYYINKGISENDICILVPQWYLVMSIAGRLRNQIPDIPIDATGVGPMSGSRDNFFYKLARLFMTDPSPRSYSMRHRWAQEIIGEFQHYYSDPTLEESISPKKLLKLVNSIFSDETEAIPYLKHCFQQLFSAINLEINKTLENSYSSYFKGMERRIKDSKNSLSTDIETFRNFFKEARGIVISSCHGVKGEEFEVVIAFGLVLGHLPHWSIYYSKEIDQNDNTKKLLYVICSRAKNYLHLISERGRNGKFGDLEVTPQLAQVEFDYDDEITIKK